MRCKNYQNVPVSIVSLTGHSIHFEPREELDVPDVLITEVLARGIVPLDEIGDPVARDAEAEAAAEAEAIAKVEADAQAAREQAEALKAAAEQAARAAAAAPRTSTAKTKPVPSPSVAME